MMKKIVFITDIKDVDVNNNNNFIMKNVTYPMTAFYI